jgi:hypothetical protein
MNLPIARRRPGGAPTVVGPPIYWARQARAGVWEHPKRVGIGQRRHGRARHGWGIALGSVNGLAEPFTTTNSQSRSECGRPHRPGDLR